MVEALKLRDEAERLGFSEDAVKILQDVYGANAGEAAEAMKRPCPKYYFRVNTLKASVGEVKSNLRAQGINAFQDPHLPEALYVQVDGPFTIPLYEKRVVVDRATAESVLQGAHVYAPGVKSCRKLKVGDLVTVVDDVGQPVGSGKALMSETQVLTARGGLAVLVTDHVYRVPSLRELEEYQRGLIYPQSLPAILTTIVLNPEPWMTIADLNCSPGGKLSHVCQLTGNQAEVYGMDRSVRKVKRAEETLKRLGCRNVTLTVQDTRYVDVDHPNLQVDACLVDPPCSSLGVTPKLRLSLKRKTVQALSAYQIQFLKAASRILKPGGKLVYSVCTFTVEECECVVGQAGEFGLELIPQKPFLGCGGFRGALSEWRLVQRFHPHTHGTGYFIALLQKKASS